MGIERLRFKNGKEVMSDERSIIIDSFMTMEYYGLKGESIKKTKFIYKNKTFQISQILPDTKHVQNKKAANVAKGMQISKWDFEKGMDFDYLLMIYNAGDRLLGCIAKKEDLIEQEKREANYFFTLNQIKEMYYTKERNFINVKWGRTPKSKISRLIIFGKDDFTFHSN